MFLGPKLVRDSRVVPNQELPEKDPAGVGLASRVKGFEVIPCIFQTLINPGVRSAEDPAFNRGSGNAFAHYSEVLPLELLGAALTPDSNHLINADVQEMLQELVQGVICVAAINSVYQMGISRFACWFATYITKMGPSVASAL